MSLSIGKLRTRILLLVEGKLIDMSQKESIFDEVTFKSPVSSGMVIQAVDLKLIRLCRP